MQEATILLVEDEKEAADMLSSFLKLNQFNVLTAYDGKQAQNLIEVHSKTIQLAILDIMIPYVDGKELCQQIRKHPILNEIPVIFLTAKDKERDEIEGLTIGADDYISKPASLNLVLAHVKSLLRRKPITQNQTKLEFAGVGIDTETQEIFVRGKRIELTATEFQIVKLLFNAPKRIFSRQDILEFVMPEDHYVFDRTVDVHVKNIRIKLGDGGDIIKTYRGVGYGVNKDLAGI
jgi:DNA-binding response OmpR family regulator